MSRASALSTLGKVQGPTRDIAEELWDYLHSKGYDLTRVWGMGSAGSEHPTGRALDLMITGSKLGKKVGDLIAAYLWANRTRLRVKWLIWDRRIRSTSPGKSGNWTAYRGASAHTDHVHVFFAEGAYRPPAGGAGGGGGQVDDDGIPGVWEVDPAKVSTYLWGLKGGKSQNIKAAPGRDIDVVKQVKDKRRTWLVTAHDNWFAKAYLRRKK
jgi:hypothetical protein